MARPAGIIRPIGGTTLIPCRATELNDHSGRLEYQHGFHAGNFADVFKHVLLVMLLQHMQKKKNKPIGYVETHAGAGLYSLVSSTESNNHDDNFEHKFEREHQRGVWRLLELLGEEDTAELPTSLATYLNIVKSFQNINSSEEEVIYPGSPLFAASLLTQQPLPIEAAATHSMRLYEKAPTQLELLQNHLKAFLAKDNNSNIDVHLYCDNGYTSLAQYAQSTPSLEMPPRALILIDPPYQYGSDTEQIVALVATLRHHWKSARCAIWHPVRADHADKLERLYSLLRANKGDDEILAVEVYAPPSSGGEERKPDVGTGMILIQPPYGIDTECQEVLPQLLEMLHPESSSKNEQPSIRIKWL